MQVWWPQKLKLLVETPVLPTQHKDLLTIPHKGTQHPLSSKMQMLQCRENRSLLL